MPNTAPYVPGTVVPAVPPKPPLTSLLDAALTVTNTTEPSGSEITDAQLEQLPADLRAELAARDGEMWTRGFVYLPESQTAIHVRDPYDNTDDGKAGSDLSPPINIVVPYMLEAIDEASTFGFEARDWEGRAKRHLENGKYQAVEREFWAGSLAQAKSYPNRYLADANCVDLTPTTVPSVERGFQILAEALATGKSGSPGMGGQGMIHCQSASVPTLFWAVRSGNTLQDINGNIIVRGDGYPGTGPLGNSNFTPPAGQTWIYASDLVMAREQQNADVFADTMAEMTDIGIDVVTPTNANTVYYRARKLAVAYFDGFRQFACRVDLYP
jgi:hypothetical protein